jgi:hypothetical protein
LNVISLDPDPECLTMRTILILTAAMLFNNDPAIVKSGVDQLFQGFNLPKEPDLGGLDYQGLLKPASSSCKFIPGPGIRARD